MEELISQAEEAFDCSHCGTPVAPDKIFCVNCGFPELMDSREIQISRGSRSKSA